MVSTAAPRRYLSNGRIVDTDAGLGPLFSVRRLLFVAVMVSALLLTNPANEPYTWKALFRHDVPLDSVDSKTTKTKTRKQRQKQKQLQQDDFSSSTRVTNYAWCCVRERLTRLEIHVAGTVVNCPFNDSLQGQACRALQANLLPMKPLVWDAYDRPFTVHRILTLALIAAGGLSFCCRRPNALSTGILRVDALLSIFLPIADTQQSVTITATIASLLQSQVFLYAVWQRMDVLIPLQHPNSIFFWTPSNDWNFAISVLMLVALAGACNATSKYATGRFVLQGCEALTAVALGYYRGSVMDTATDHASFLLFFYWHVSLAAAQWTALVAVATSRRSFFATAIVAWCVANVVGSLMGEYQYQNQISMTMKRQVWETVENAWETLFGYRY